MGELTLPLPATGTTAGAPTGRIDAARLRMAGDARLTRLAQEGDKRAFEGIFERHHQALYRYCASIVRSPEDASDALQSTMLKAMLALPAKRAEVVLKPWLYRIAHNEAVSILRRRRSHEEITEASGPVAEGTDIDAARRARLRDLLSDLDHLPERQRGALVMRELNGLAFADIGLAFGVSPAAAKQAVYEARTALHERAEGRDMSCEATRRSLSDGDGRIARGRRIRSHLSDCAGCREFKETISTRRGDLAALTPPIEVAAAASILHGLIGGGAGSGGGFGGGLAAGLGKLGAASGVFKSAAVGASILAAAGTAGFVVGGGPNGGAAAGWPPPPTQLQTAVRSEPTGRLVASRVPALVPIAALQPLSSLADVGDRSAREGRSSAVGREAPLVATLREEGPEPEDAGTVSSGAQPSGLPGDGLQVAVDAPTPSVSVPRLPPGTPRLPNGQPLQAPGLRSPLDGSARAPGVLGVRAPDADLPAPALELPRVETPAVSDDLQN